MAKEFEEKVLEKLDQMQSDIRRLEVLHEETDGKIEAIIEGMSPTLEKVVDHELRITRLESATS
ncbi:MAG TPA: hypothetical protein VLA77_04925 [Candidatus Saccharimonadales bacterium]|nr:hypothetical protein [Candidatus Saccharimonadales bacterium]